MEVKLLVLKGKAKGKAIPLPSSQFVIGRGSACHLRPHSELVSKMHCVIGRQAGYVVVRDLKSSNHTYINDRPIRGAARVEDGDILSVGPLQFRFVITSGKPGTLVQHIREDEVEWLLEEHADSFVMDSDHETKIITVPPHLLDETSDAPENCQSDTGSQRMPTNACKDCSDEKLSAGKYLHQYFNSQNGNNA